MNSLPYQELCTQFYALDKPSAPKEALDFYLRYAKQVQGPILEPMCGTGNFLIPLIEAGCDITGFDKSPQMLTLCQKKCQKLRVNPNLQLGSFETVEFDKLFQLVMIPSSSFCLLTTDQEISLTLSCLHKALKPGGRFLFEIETPLNAEEYQDIWLATSIDKPDGSKLVLSTSSHFNPITQIQTTLCRYLDFVQFFESSSKRY